MKNTGRNILILFTAVFLFSLLNPSPDFIMADDKNVLAYLESGPVPCSGMPGIGMNSISGYRGIYSLPAAAADAGEKTQISVSVYFTNTVIPVFSEWTVLKSGSNTVYRIGSGSVFIYRHSENWTLFIDFSSTGNIAGSRSRVDEIFIEKLITQMIFFARDGSNFMNTSFPAVIELR